MKTNISHIRIFSETSHWLSMTKSFFVLILFVYCSLLIVHCSLLQAQSITWQRTYDAIPDGQEGAFGISPADGTNNYIVGQTSIYASKQFIVKINVNGDTLWTRMLDSVEQANCVAKTNDDGCVIGGYTGYASLCKYDKNGNFQWLHFYTGSAGIFDVKSLSNGNIIVCGYSVSNGTNIGYFANFDSLGNIIWQRTYAFGNLLELSSIDLAIDGGFVVAGNTIVNSNGTTNSYIAHLSNSGNIIWQKSFSLSPGFTRGSKIIGNFNNYVLAGSAGFSAYLMRLNLNGDSLKFILLNGTSNLFKVNAIKYNINKFFISRDYGNFEIFQTVDSNFTIIRQLQLSADQNYTLMIFGADIASQSNEQDVICVGTTDILSLGNSDFYAVRLDSSLTPPPPIGIVQIQNNISTDFQLFQNYPNPFNPTTNIKYDLPRDGMVSLKVYDVLGKLVYSTSEFKKAGTYSFMFDGTNYASGLYIYRIETANFTDSKKMVLIK